MKLRINAVVVSAYFITGFVAFWPANHILLYYSQSYCAASKPGLSLTRVNTRGEHKS